MDKITEELMLLKSQGIESLSVDKLLSIIKEADNKQDTKTLNTSSDIFPVGGTIFYIDEDDDVDGKYEFFDSKGNQIKRVRVGDRPYAYRVIEKGQYDMYYVYHDKVYDNLRWTYSEDGKYVYEYLDTSTKIRAGKTNTEKVLNRDWGAYIFSDSDGCPTIWYQLQKIRNTKVGGCDDWYVPSRGEILMLYNAAKSEKIRGGVIAGPCCEYSEICLGEFWTSSDNDTDEYHAWLWQGLTDNWYYGYKNSVRSGVFIRSF